MSENSNSFDKNNPDRAGRNSLPAIDAQSPSPEAPTKPKVIPYRLTLGYLRWLWFVPIALLLLCGLAGLCYLVFIGLFLLSSLRLELIAAFLLLPGLLLGWFCKSLWLLLDRIARGELHSIKLCNDKIVFGSLWSDSLFGRPSRTWSDVHSLDFTGNPAPAALSEWKALSGCSITMDFKSGGSALLELERMRKQDVEQLFLAVERYADQSVFTKRALLLERNLVALDCTDTLPISYTSIWTDALDMQFSSTNFAPLRTGTLLQSEQYEVRMQLASGGLSAVYFALRKPNVKVVLKESVLPPDTDEKTRAKAKELFDREARLLAKLDHPQIAKVIDHFVENGRDYIVLQFIAGSSLRQLTKSHQSLEPQQIMSWALQIAELLEYLHNLSPPIIHRDLTPDNLIVQDDDKIALIDFGVSNEFLSKATGTLVGKQAYIPPEQFRGKAEPKSDVYAFGATVHFLLTGDDPEPLSVSQPRAVLDTVPPRLNDLVFACTQLEATTRPDARSLVKMCRALKSGS